MFEYLDRLREKPIGARKRIAFFSTVSIFSVIVLVWWTTFTNPLDSGVIKASDNVATPIQVMGGLFEQVRDSAKQLPVQITNYMQNVATSTKGAQELDEQVDARDLMNATSSAERVTPTPAPQPEAIPKEPAPAPDAQTRATPVPPPAPLVSPKPPQPPPPPANLIPTRPGTISASS